MSKRRWFQIHLSTAVVMMVAGGLLIGANLRDRWPVVFMMEGDPLGGDSKPSAITEKSHGIPFTFESWTYHSNERRFSVTALAANAVVGIVLIGMTALCSEYLIRRGSNFAAV